MHLTFVNNKAQMTPVLNTRLWIVREIVKTTTDRIRCIAREHGTCLNRESPMLPFCLYGAMPVEQRIDIDTLLMPSFLEVRMPDHLTNIKIEHTLEQRAETKKLVKSTTTVRKLFKKLYFQVPELN